MRNRISYRQAALEYDLAEDPSLVDCPEDREDDDSYPDTDGDECLPAYLPPF